VFLQCLSFPSFSFVLLGCVNALPWGTNGLVHDICSKVTVKVISRDTPGMYNFGVRNLKRLSAWIFPGENLRFVFECGSLGIGAFNFCQKFLAPMDGLQGLVSNSPAMEKPKLGGQNLQMY